MSKSRVSVEDVVKQVVIGLEDAFGKGLVESMEELFSDNLYKVSFKDNSIVEHPDKFVEALHYTFGSASKLILSMVNQKLALLVPFKGIYEITDSSAYGYVFLINRIKRMIVEY
jgi:hypothetical protein